MGADEGFHAENGVEKSWKDCGLHALVKKTWLLLRAFAHFLSHVSPKPNKEGKIDRCFRDDTEGLRNYTSQFT